MSLCSVYALDGALSFCYEMDEAAGTILHDASAAGNNGTISPSGIAFQSPPLASTSLGSLRGTTSSGQLTSNYAPGAGSFSVSFFMELFANGQNWPFIAATGNPSHSTAGKGWDIVVNADPNNSIYVDIGYGSGSTSFGYMPLTLNTPYNVTLTYNEGTKLATLYVGTASSVSSRSATLPASFAATGTGVLFSGALSFNAVAANASFDEAGYWTGTVLSAAQVTTIAGYTGAGSGPPPTPVPTATAPPGPTPTPTVTPPVPAGGLCSVYTQDGALSFCYEMDESAGSILHDASAAGNNGTISPSGIAFQSPPLASTSLGSLRGTTSSGQLTSNYAPAAGSFSASFFLELFSNGQNWPFIAATGNPSHSTPGKGWDIVINADPNNSIYVDIGYGSGSTSFGYLPLNLNTPYNITLTYNESTKLATLYAGTASSVSSRSATLPASFAATGTGVLFSGALSFNAVAANAGFDEAGYWTGTVLSPAQVSTIAGYTGAGSGPPPTPAPTATPTSAPTVSP
ncbi:MAG: hypothetical protein ACREM8_07515, partial [Vulcanimicrobiaceae bacterium]